MKTIKKSKVYPLVKNAFSKKTLDNIDFRITSIYLDKTKENWLRLYVSWNAEKDCYKVKRVCYAGHSSSSEGMLSVFLEFPDLTDKDDFAAGIEVGINHNAKKNVLKEYDYGFF